MNQDLIKMFKPGMKFKHKTNKNANFTLTSVTETKPSIHNKLTEPEITFDGIYSCKEDYGRGRTPYVSKRYYRILIEEFIENYDYNKEYLEKFEYKNVWEESRWNKFHLYAGNQGWECHWNIINQNFDKPWRTRDADANESLKNKFAYKKYVEKSCLTKNEANDFYNRVDLKTWMSDFKDKIKAGRNAYYRACTNNNYLTDREAHSLFYNM